MQQFDLSLWLQNKSRKVVTRDGRSVRIICTDAKGKLPIIALVPFGDSEDAYHYNKNGVANGFESITLFFADEEEELTELQKTLEEDCDYYVNLYNDGKTREELREWIKCWCNSIIDLARKELKKKFVLLAKEDYQTAFDLGKAEVLKDLPKWKKVTDETNLSLTISNGDYYLTLEDLETLPKEE